MSDARSLLVGVAVLLGLGMVIALIILASKSGTRSPISSKCPGQRLALLASQRSDYQILVGTPPREPVCWSVASRVANDAVTVVGYGDIPLSQVTAFIVTYSNGQAVDCELADLPMPVGVTGLSPGRKRHEEVLRSDDLEEGRKYVKVKYGPSQLRPKDRSHYSTTLTNISHQRIRVLRFAGYARSLESWRLNTVTGTFYSAREFLKWYGLGQDEWIQPGSSATDPNNYGSPPVLWAYYCQAEDGKEFIAGEILE